MNKRIVMPNLNVDVCIYNKGVRAHKNNYVIDMGDSPPVHVTVIGVKLAIREMIQTDLQEMQTARVITPSKSPYCQPVLLVKKKDVGLKISFNFQKLNEKIMH